MSELYHERISDLRLLYQVYSVQIEFSKNQLWRIASLGLWSLAGLLGLFSLLNGWEKYLCIYGVSASTTLSSCCTIRQPLGGNCASRCQNIGNQAYGAVAGVNSAMPCKLLWPEPETPFQKRYPYVYKDWGGIMFSKIGIHKSLQYVSEQCTAC